MSPRKLFLNRRKSDVQGPPPKLCHLLVKHKQSRSPFDSRGLPVTRTRPEARKLIKCIHYLLTAGTYCFDQTLEKFSDCETKANKGIVQLFPRGSTKPYEPADFGLRPNKISDYKESANGFHIFYSRGNVKPNVGRRREKAGSYRLCQILVKHKYSLEPTDTLDLPVTRSRGAALELIKNLHYLISNRLFTFAALVPIYSDCFSKYNQGVIDIKPYEKAIYRETFQDATCNLPLGQHSDVIESPNGFHILCYRRVKSGERPLRSRCESCCGYYKPGTFSNEPVASPMFVMPTGANPPEENPPAANLKLSHILIKHAESNRAFGKNNQPVTRSRNLAMEFARELRKGLSSNYIIFAEYAFRYSDCACGPDGGSIEKPFRQGIMQKLFDEAALTPGDIVSGIVESTNGFHIFHRHLTNEPVANPTAANLKLSHILIKHVESNRPFDKHNHPVTLSKNRAMEFARELRDGISLNCISFAEAAVRFSDCASGPNGGNIAKQFKPGIMKKSFDEAALALAPGEISEIVESGNGFHILHHRLTNEPVANPTVTIPNVANPSVVNPSAAKLKLSHILIKHNESNRPFDRQNLPVTRSKYLAFELAGDIRVGISINDITFAEAAIKYSDCASGPNGGNIEKQFTPGKMRKAFDEAALALAPGDISEIVETGNGFHILHRRHK